MKHLRTTDDVKKFRKILLEKQNGTCKITGAPLDFKDSVLDHDHDTQLVRGVVHRQTNAMLGKVEGAYKRMLKWWCPIPLPRILRMLAYYLDNCQEEPIEVYHPGWIKKSCTEFNKLPSKCQVDILKAFYCNTGKNGSERKVIWKKLLLSKAVSYDEIKETLEYVNLKLKRGNYD